MRILEIAQSAIDDPARMDAAKIEVEMLWPHDDAARNRGLIAAAAQQYIDDAKSQNLVIDADSAADLLAVPRIVDVREAAIAAHRHGVVAGTILWESVASASSGEARSPIPVVKQRLAKYFGKKQISQSNINNYILPRYRPVAHLWAARIQRVNAGIDNLFPCSFKDIGNFLAMAEEFRKMGEILKLPHSPMSSILRPAETLSLPEGLILPKIRLEFS